MRISILNISIISIFLMCACSNVPKYYQGYIYDLNNKPLTDIKICEENKNNCIQTDNKGFFRLKKNEISINNLILFYNGKPIDTLITVWSQHGEKIKYSYIENNVDTLFIDLKNRL